ncbi:MAG: cytochrome c maturation protein CcmE [Candidatus Latescibacteria bacterium]|nr:cytochrome c maturation protein CcmE [Candidatus Latescibacterota bacterium]
MSTDPNGTPRRHFWGIRVRLLIGLVAIGVAIGLLVFRKASDTAVYYVTVSELLAQESQGEREGLRVVGTVVPGSIQSEPMRVRFQMTDGAEAIPVDYQGVIPDTFGDKGEVTVEGRYRDDGTFEANFLMAKCPSKYEMSPDEELPEAMDQVSASG